MSDTNPKGLRWKVQRYLHKRPNTFRWGAFLWSRGKWIQVLGDYSGPQAARKAADHGWGPQKPDAGRKVKP